MGTNQTGIIIGAGPAGLSAAETISATNKMVTVLEANSFIGGLSTTIHHNGFFFDLGGHRFFTKNKEIDQYVARLLGDEKVMVDRSSKILLRGKFFDYPLKPMNAMFGLGPFTAMSIVFNYLTQRLKVKDSPPKSLEDWMVREFGVTLYRLFFKTYTEKVWGIPCSRISAAWGTQRIKGLSLRTAIMDAIWKRREKDAASLITHFAFPRKGIGVICDKLAATIKPPNRLLCESPATALYHSEDKIKAVEYGGPGGGGRLETDFVISSMPITELIFSLRPEPPADILAAARALKYRDLVCVALMFDLPFVTDQTWIYVHEQDIEFGRLHEPRNWSIDMAPQGKACVVFEYFCNEGDAIWNSTDSSLVEKTKRDFEKARIAPGATKKLIDYKVVKSAKAYPSYAIGFSHPLLKIRDYLKKFKNLQLIGRYGTYKYNNLDHSIETGIKGAQNILGAHHDTFMVNMEDEYLEEIR